MVKLAKIAGAALLVPCALACTPEFSDRSSAVLGPRVLAVRSEPAEASPGANTSYELLVVNDEGPVPTLRATWSYCTQPKSTNELNDVSPTCFGSGSAVTEFGSGVSPTGRLPVNACAQFGPDVPQPTSGPGTDSSGNSVNQTQGRPTDADSTGGYYQPVIVDVFTTGISIPTLAETRITCALAGLEPLATGPPQPLPGIMLLDSFLLGTERYRYPGNLPKVAAKGGPQCMNLPNVGFGERPPFVVTDIDANPGQYGNQGILLNSDALKEALFGPLDGPPRNTAQVGQPG